MKQGIRLATFAFFAVWVPYAAYKGIAMGRQFRIGSHGQGASSPLVDAIIQVAFASLAPALFVALGVFVFWAWREERRHERELSKK